MPGTLAARVNSEKPNCLLVPCSVCLLYGSSGYGLNFYVYFFYTTSGTLMRLAGVQAKQKKKFKATTNSKHNLPVSPNLLKREFTVLQPNMAWVGDITYIWTEEGWLYLAVVIDLYSRRVVGWSINKRMTKQLVMDALLMAIWRRKPAAGLIFHSDRGSQYCSHAFQKLLKTYAIQSSMSRKGDCWDTIRLKTEV